jgi:hypothetical protein
MVGFLLIYRANRDLAPKSCFSVVKMVALRNKKRRFEIDDFAILSLARLPISPPWQSDFGL